MAAEQVGTQIIANVYVNSIAIAILDVKVLIPRNMPTERFDTDQDHSAQNDKRWLFYRDLL